MPNVCPIILFRLPVSLNTMPHFPHTYPISKSFYIRPIPLSNYLALSHFQMILQSPTYSISKRKELPHFPMMFTLPRISFSNAPIFVWPNRLQCPSVHPNAEYPYRACLLVSPIPSRLLNPYACISPYHPWTVYRSFQMVMAFYLMIFSPSGAAFQR